MKSPLKIVISQKILVNFTGAFCLLRLQVFAFLICLITLAGCGGGGGDDGNGPDNGGNGPDNNGNGPDNLTFDIDLIFFGDVTEDQKELFRQAARRWEAIITSDIPDQKIVRDSDSIVRDSDCVNDASFIVDDLRIYVEITGIDGPHGTLALAGPEHVRDQSLLQVAFDYAGGVSYPGNKVPVENQEGPGSQDGHWRESVFGDEIMSPFVSGSVEPLSAITIQSLADSGYAVDISQADPYRLPPRGSSTPRAPGRRIHLENDIRSGPVRVVDTNGRVVRIIE